MSVIYTDIPVSNLSAYKVRAAKDTSSGSTTQLVIQARVLGGVVVPYTDDDPAPIAGSISVSLASSSTTTGSVASVTTTTAQVLASNSSRKGGWVKNIGDCDVYVGLGYSAATNKPTKLTPGEVLQLASGAVKFTGAVNAIVDTGLSGTLEVVEL